MTKLYNEAVNKKRWISIRTERNVDRAGSERKWVKGGVAVGVTTSAFGLCIGGVGVLQPRRREVRLGPKPAAEKARRLRLRFVPESRQLARVQMSSAADAKIYTLSAVADSAFYGRSAPMQCNMCTIPTSCGARGLLYLTVQ